MVKGVIMLRTLGTLEMGEVPRLDNFPNATLSAIKFSPIKRHI
jgi:hypothetical protein